MKGAISMNRTDGFEIITINGSPYLLPYGQRLAEHRPGMRLSESGIFLWNALPSAKNREELLAAFAAHYEALPHEIPELERDMNAFIDELISWGMLESDLPARLTSRTFSIGGLHLRLNLPPELEFPYFDNFAEASCPNADMTVEIIPCGVPCGGIPHNGVPYGGAKESAPKKHLLISTEEVLIADAGSWYSIFFPLSPQIHECRLKKDGTLYQLFITPPFREPLPSDLFHAIRPGFLFRAQMLGRIGIHSASLYYREKVWLFAGSSGTGKSTHTNLWKTQFGTPLINGDLNLITMSDGIPMVCGIPWCGTSGVCQPGALPLGGIIHLKQDTGNHCRPLTGEQQILSLMHRTISPSWTPEQLKKNLEISERISRHIFSTRLHCTADAGAAIYMREQIDGFLGK